MSNDPETGRRESDPDINDMNVRLEKLEAKLDKVVMPAINEDDSHLQETVSEQQIAITSLQAEVDDLKDQLDSLIGIADHEQSTHDKRVSDTKQILRRRAETNDGRASMYWKEIAGSLASHGHEDLAWTQVDRVMDDVVVAEGYTYATAKRDTASADDRTDIREVEVVQLNLDTASDSPPTNNVVGGEVPQAATDGGLHTEDSG